MLTPADLKPLDYQYLGAPFCDISLVDVSGLDASFYGEPQYLTFGNLPYSPNMATEASISVTVSADLLTSIAMSAGFSPEVSVTTFMNVGVSAKLVHIF